MPIPLSYNINFFNFTNFPFETLLIGIFIVSVIIYSLYFKKICFHCASSTFTSAPFKKRYFCVKLVLVSTKVHVQAWSDNVGTVRYHVLLAYNLTQCTFTAHTDKYAREVSKLSTKGCKANFFIASCDVRAWYRETAYQRLSFVVRRSSFTPTFNLCVCPFLGPFYQAHFQ
jgi:hypothetical protein